jgi:cobalamin biosynthesis protein CobD/CbiB
MIGFARGFTNAPMCFRRKDQAIRIPEITETVTAAIGARNALPQPLTRSRTPLSNDEGNDLERAPTHRRYFWGVYLTLQYVAIIALGSIAIHRIQKIPAWAAVVTMIATFVLGMFIESFIVR